ncbi:MAG: hypothetical protein A3G26_04805 [Betaproteobacteria bacterium RIFCSPLOWO2_12_FULL_65_110]|nr:MAG: hypothetical protein A3G26_04805 [Betaproteobacteria bacterium RIFCSPLOWO2_12_FULL_65_110]
MSVRPKPETVGEETAIVLVGDLNPKIFHPAWFAMQGLIRSSEAEKAEVEIVHQDLASFSLEWVTIQVTRDRFAAVTKSSAFRTHMRDLVAGTFTKLRHTPTRQLGINYTQRYRFPEKGEWHNFGHYLAPKSPWRSLLVSPGMRGIRIEGGRPDDDRRGFVLVTAEPAEPDVATIQIQVNDHFEAPQDAGAADGERTGYFVEIIEKDFETSLGRADKIISTLIARFTEQKEFDDGSH